MKLMTKYFLIAGSLTAAFTNFIACGAQLYKTSLKDDHTSMNSEQGANSEDPNSPEFGLHAPAGWATLPITYKVDPNMSKVQLDALQLAMKTWEMSIGKEIFKYEGVHKNITGDSFPDLYSSLNDTLNGHYFDNNWAKTGKKDSVLATTVWSNLNGDYHVINTADIRYNFDLYFLGDALRSGPVDQREIVDMQSLATHELGHLIGLSHIEEDYDSSSIMNPSIMIGEGLASRSISVGDVKRIQKIYGCEGSACDAEETAREIMNASRHAFSTDTQNSH